jgi:hypothetical protein
MGIIKEVLVLLPRFDLKEGVRAEDKEEFQVNRVKTVKFLECFNGIGKAVAPRFQVKGDKKGGSFNRQPDHLEPVVKRGNGLTALVRRGGGWDEIQFLEVERLSHFLRKAQMPKMDRIKGASEDAEFQALTPFPQVLVWPSP